MSRGVFFKAWRWAAASLACWLPAADAFGFSSGGSPVTRTLSGMLSLPDAPVVVTATFTNSGTNVVRGFFYSDQVPAELTVAPLGVKLDGQSVTNYTFEHGGEGDLYGGYVPWRWVLETPPGLPETNGIAPGSCVQVLYMLSCSNAGSFRFPYFSWAAREADSTNTVFGFGESMQRVTFVAPDPPPREYVTNGTFESWTAASTFFAWMAADVSKVTTNPAAISGNFSAQFLASRKAATLRQSIDPDGQGALAWVFNLDFACNRPGSSEPAFGFRLNHLPLPATNGIDFRVVDVDANGVGDGQLFDSSAGQWVTVLANAVTLSDNLNTAATMRVNHLQVVGRYNQAVPSYDLSLISAWASTNSVSAQTRYRVASPTNGSPVRTIEFAMDTFAIGCTAVVDNVSLVLTAPACAVLPATTNIECGSAVKLVASAPGTGPFEYRWFDSTSNELAEATGPELLLGAAQAGNYTVVITGPYGTAWASAAVTTFDANPPVVTMLGPNPLTHECHAAWFDPGATAVDQCAGPLGVATNSQVNPNVPGVYFITYAAVDSFGNSATNTRVVQVADTTPPEVMDPAFEQALTASHGGTAILPDLTGLVSASDACSPVITVVQAPAAGSPVAVGQIAVVFSVGDGNGNTNYSQLRLTVNPAPLVPPSINFYGLTGDGFFRINFSGPAGQPYSLLGSTNAALSMSEWSLLSNGVFGETPTAYTNAMPGNVPAFFFRVVSP